jgi:beta-ureidopropionase / N-carbamoyl-L-amino-acid hydrolase
MMNLQQFNQASFADALTMLDGLYEHSPWIVQRALVQRPFTSLAALKHACAEVVSRLA